MARKTKEEQERLKELALLIYIENSRITNKDLAIRVGVTQKTISKWIETEKWEKKRTSLIITKQKQIHTLYNQLEELQHHISTRPIIYDVPLSIQKPLKVKDADGAENWVPQNYDPEDYPIKQNNFPNSKEADIISKLTSSIERLETETSLGEIIQVSKELIEFIAQDDYEQSKVVARLLDEFINHKMI